MTRLMIVAHAPLASALKSVAMHAFPEAASSVVAIDVQPSDQPESVVQKMRAALPAGIQALVLCDAVGATPCNAAQRLARDGHVHVLAGVNVPMVWRALCYAQEPLAELTQRALSGAEQGVKAIPQAGAPHD